MPLFAKKSLGQHFLNSKHVLGQIIEAAEIKKEETILEIGPGTGILTQPLLDSGAKVIAVEKDDRAITFLQGIFTREIESGQFKLIHGDILKLRESSEVHGAAETSPGSDWPSVAHQDLLLPPYSVVANIPYYITGAILQSFLEYSPRPNRMILLVQKEVAERIVAKGDHGEETGGKESILSISVKAFGKPSIIANVPRGAFTPPPNVDSAILSIQNISGDRFTQNNVEISRFFRILKAGFAHKRKYLKRNIEEILDAEQKIKFNEKWQQLGLDEKVRAEDLKLEKWFELASF